MTDDIFLWANQIDAMKHDLEVEFFIFNKNYTPYSMKLDYTLDNLIKPLFLFDLINAVNLGAGVGLQVRDLETSDAEANVLLRTDLKNVGRAETLLYTIDSHRDDIVPFNEREHEMKRQIGLIARFTHPADPSIKFDVFKLLVPSSVNTNVRGWQFDRDSFSAQAPEVTFKVPPENHVLVVGESVFAFAPAKFDKLFRIDVRKFRVAEQNGKRIDQLFKLSMPTIDQGIAFMARDRSSLLDRLIKVDPDFMSHDQALEAIEDLGLQLMVSDNNEIILMDDKDVATFLSLLGDDFVEGSQGDRYISRNKKPLEPGE